MKPQPFFLLSKLAGWQGLSYESIDETEGGCALQLAPAPGTVVPLDDPAGTLGSFVNPVGVAVDTKDRIYILDAADALVKRFDPCAGSFETLPCLGGKGAAPREFIGPRAIAISPRDDMYIVDTGNARIQVFSIKGLALRTILTVPSTLKAWDPRDIAISRACRSYVADYLNGLVHVYDAAGCWLRSYDGSGPNSAALTKPIRIAVDRQRNIYVVQEGAGSVVVLKPDGTYSATITSPSDLAGRFCPTAMAVNASGDLYVTDQFQPFLRQFGCGPWRRKSCSKPAASASNSSLNSLTFDNSGNLIATTGKQVVQISAAGSFETDGTFITNGLDSRIYRCPWHRVVMHCNIPTGTQITVETLTAEDTKTATEIASLPDATLDSVRDEQYYR